ncbi:unnamed protein product [Prorocentrum cordatum]|uniref:Cyclin N-terminal domain-containing protein n=1 Tax=Prorocentrum cordatum TaxID=2364126 RepID=A0ABN9UTI8_9DINO|nr:unnamed protein product [Polarella glacialis]
MAAACSAQRRPSPQSPARLCEEEGLPDGLLRRRFGSLIWRVGADLQMSPTGTATAALYFQRFLLVAPSSGEEGFSTLRAAMSCVWLASKTLEEPQRLRDVANAFLALEARSAGRGAPVLEMEAYWALRDEVVWHEQVVLRAMAFDAEPTPAYALLAELGQVLCGAGEARGVPALAWALLNDAFCSEACAVWPPAPLAAACLLLAVELGRRAPWLRGEAERVRGRLARLCREPGELGRTGVAEQK